MNKGMLLTPPVAACDHEAMIGLCRQLIERPSYTGHEREVASLLHSVMAALGFDDVRLDAAGNVIGEIRGRLPGPRLLFDGHIDTVEVSDRDKWSVDPFAGVIEDGRLYGRGASDMKCALAAMIYGLAPFINHRDKLKGSLFISGTVCEETFEGLALGKVVEAVRPDYVVIGEASALSLKRGQRGRAEIAVRTFGQAAHSSNPAAGKNAVYMMLQLVERILRAAVPTDPFLGDGIIELTDIISAPYPGASVVPHECRATFDRRLLVGETAESVLAPVRECIAALALADGAFRATAEIVQAEQVCYTGETLAGTRFFPAWVLPESHPLVAGALAGLRQSGLKPIVTKYSFCTNGSHSAGIAGIPTIGFGPGREDGAHVRDEYIELSQLTGAAVGYQAIAASLLDFS